MITLHVTDRQGQRSDHRVAEGQSLMVLLRDAARLPVEGLCGGCATCGTCHVFVDPDWAGRLPPVTPHEAGMLDMLDHRDPVRSRLACQIVAGARLDGLRLTLAPEE